MASLKLWFKTLCRIVAHYDTEMVNARIELANARSEIARLEGKVTALTKVSASIGFSKGENYIVAIGRYANTDYVEIHKFRDDDFSQICKQLKHMRKEGVIDRIDCPPNLNYIFNRSNRQF